VAHVGDSRAFLVHAGSIFQVTRDHSMVQQMVDAQLLTPEQAAHHPEANKITRALGIAPDVEVELRAQPLMHAAGDIFVLCSDGLSDLVSMQEISDVTQGAPYERAASDLVDMANARGGHDNVTVVMVRAREGVAPSRLPLGGVPGPLGSATTEEIPAYGPTRTLSIPVAALAAAAPAPSAPPPHQAATKTLVGAPLPLPPGADGAYAGPASVRLPHAPPPRAHHDHAEHAAPRVSRLLVAIGVVVALLALGGAGVLIYLHLEDRNGSHHDTTADGGTLSLGLGGPAHGPVSLVPSHVDAGAGTVPVVNPGAAAGPTGSQLRR
jgi:protein phosphatase